MKYQFAKMRFVSFY